MTAYTTMVAKGKGSILVIFLCLLSCTAGSNSACDGFTYRPYNQDVPEGTNSVTFMCRFARAIYVGWLINGTGTNEFLPAAITTGSVIYNGDEVSTLTIAALPEYNGIVVGCLATLPSHELCLVNATLLIRAPPRIDNLDLHPSSTELLLTWNHSHIPTNYTIEICINIYRIVGEVKMYVCTECGIEWSKYTFSTNETERDPNVLFQFFITAKYNVDGARNGTSRSISGYFIAKPPMLAEDSINVDVSILQDWQVHIVIMISNAETWITGGRKVDRFHIEVMLHSQLYVCSSVEPRKTVNSTLSLYPSCNGLPVQRVGYVNVTAINRAGNSSLLAPLSTHFIQNIRIIPCDSNQCQFKVVYDVVADHKVTGGSFIMLYNGEDDIHYFVGRHMDSIPVKGLTRDHYNVLVFPLNESGLPFELPSNPRKEIVNVSTYKVDGDQRTVHLRGLKHSDGNYFQCLFWSNSSASYCVVMVHTINEVISSSLFERSGDSAEGRIVVEPGWYYVVAFAYTNSTIHGYPYKAGRTLLEIHGEHVAAPIIAVAVLVAGVIIIVAVVCAVSVAWKCYKDHQRKINDTTIYEYHKQVQHDPKATTDNLSDNQITTQLSDLEKELQTVSTMEELLTCVNRFNLKWPIVYDALLTMNKRQLAGDVYTVYILPKAIKQQDQTDSGRYTLTTSEDIDEGGDPAQAVKDEVVVFGEAQPEHERNGPSSLATKSNTLEDADATQRAVHKQETAAGSDYNKEIRDTLNTKPEGSPHHSGYKDDDALPIVIGKEPPIIPFHINYSSAD